ncbi:MAG: hypothetical protein SFX18_03280 [Pirellulales bacterium]|nr:hypothetical protein [Pirellulales bacterium]
MNKYFLGGLLFLGVMVCVWDTAEAGHRHRRGRHRGGGCCGEQVSYCPPVNTCHGGQYFDAGPPMSDCCGSGGYASQGYGGQGFGGQGCYGGQGMQGQAFHSQGGYQGQYGGQAGAGFYGPGAGGGQYGSGPTFGQNYEGNNPSGRGLGANVQGGVNSGANINNGGGAGQGANNQSPNRAQFGNSPSNNTGDVGNSPSNTNSVDDTNTSGGANSVPAGTQPNRL